ncbi:MAG: amidohydrolase [Acidobacteria bacterium]|nr:amidohydrolase [Acidobacteriota bacterium]
MKNSLSRRNFLATAAAAVPLGVMSAQAASAAEAAPGKTSTSDRIVDVHIHFDAKDPNFIDNFLKVSDKLNLTGCILTPFQHRKVVADAARKHPAQIIPIGFVELDAADAAQQVKELHDLGYRGLGELENPKKAFVDRSYDPVYELANQYSWIILFHTGIVMREVFDQPEDVSSGRMRPVHLEEIARRFPKLTVLGAHCGNPEYEWAAEVSRWNPNVFFDVSGSTLQKMRGRLNHFQDIFWWTGVGQDTATPNNDPSAFIKLVFGSDTYLARIEAVVGMYRALFDACDVPEATRKMILGGTMAQFLGLPA